MNTQTYIPDAEQLPQGRLWFGPLAGATAFSLAGFTNWVIADRACYIGHGYLGSLTPTDVRWLLVGVTVVLFAFAVSGALVSYRYWHRMTQSTDVAHAEGKAAAEFISLVGVFASSILSVGIIWISIPLILIDVCMRAH